MNSVLLSAAVGLALALIAALVVPFFVDWGTFRGTVESRASAALGVPVEIEGDLSVRLLPSPVVDASGVKIGESGGFQAERIEMRLGLTPLIQGDVQIDQLRITAPRIHINLSSDGALAHNPIAGMTLDASRVSLAALDVRRGIITVNHPDRELPMLLGLPVLTGGFESLQGPFKLDGAIDRRGQTYDLTLNTGGWNAGGSQPENAGGQMRTQLVLAARGRPVAADFDGLVMATRDNRLSFKGQSRFERIVADGEDALPFVIRGETTADGEKAEFSDLVVELGDPAARVALEGSGSAQFGRSPEVTVALEAQQADFDRLTSSLSTGPDDDRSLFGLLGKLASVSLPMRGTVDAEIGRAIISGNIVERARARFGFSGPQIVDAGTTEETERPGTWRAEDVRAILPGDSAIRLSGDVDSAEADEGQGRLTGRFAIQSERPRILADWLFPGERARNAWIEGALDAEGGIAMGRDGIAVTDIEATLGESRLSGAIVAMADAPAEVTLQADQLQLGALRALADRLGQANTPGRGLVDDEAGLLAGRGLKLDLGVDRILSEDFVAGGMRLRAGVVDGRLELDEASVDDLAGAQISARSGETEGSLSMAVTADRVDGLAELLRVFGQTDLADRMAASPTLFAPLDLSGGLTPEAGVNGPYEVVASGQAGPAQVSLSGVMGTDIARWREVPLELELEATAPDALSLLRQAGIAAGAIAAIPAGNQGDAAVLTLSLEGTPEERLDTDFSLSQGETRLTLKGGVWFPGGGADGPGLDLVAEAEAIPPQLMTSVLGDWAAGLETSVGVTGRIDGVPPYALRAIRIDLGENRIIGDGVYDPDFASKRRLTLNLEAESLSLPWVATRALGPQAPIFMAALAGDAEYPADPIGWRLPDGLELRGKVSAKALSVLEDVDLRDADVEFELESNGLRLSQLSGSAYGGEVSGAVSLNQISGETLMSGRLTVEGVEFSDFVWERGGRPIAEGALDLSATFESAARSFEGLVAQATGNGAFAVSQASLRGVTEVAFDQIVSAADEGMELNEASITPLLAAYLDQGSVDVGTMELPFSLAGGVVRFSRVSIDAGELTFLASGSADLTERTLQSNWSVRAKPDPDAPDSVREFGMRFDGPFKAPTRSLDTQPLISLLTIRAFEKEVERIEREQAALHERGRMDRELRHQRRLSNEEARRQREEAEAERARERAAARARQQREAREAARRAARIEAQEAARRAQEPDEQRLLREAQEAAQRQQDLRTQQTVAPPPSGQGQSAVPEQENFIQVRPRRSPLELQGIDPAGG
jgi:hypothetical protein